jgi:hypothetical protein
MTRTKAYFMIFVVAYYGSHTKIMLTSLNEVEYVVLVKERSRKCNYISVSLCKIQYLFIIFEFKNLRKIKKKIY